MNLRLSLLCLTLLLASCHSSQRILKSTAPTTVQEIDELIRTKSYFKAREQFEVTKASLSTVDRLRIEATLLSLFNQLEASNELLEVLFEEYESQLDRGARKGLLNTQLANSVKLFDYQLADQISQRLLTEFVEQSDEEELWDVKNSNIIWEALKSYPPQRVHFREASRLQLFRDKANLKNLEVYYQDRPYPFIFDTGANLSTLIQSQAQIMNVEVIEGAVVSVGTITGKRVDAQIGLAPTFEIGAMTFENVVFLIFPDEAFYVPSLDYQIKGILGFPVIAAMKEIHFIKEEEVFVPLGSTVDHPSNLAIEYLTPIINLATKNGDQYFSFDTGADATLLYERYFVENKKKIVKQYEKTDIRFAGGGGGIELEGYEVLFEPIINGQVIAVDSVSLIPTTIQSEDQYLYGNIGQDLISKFDKMILNFESMFVRFE